MKALRTEEFGLVMSSVEKQALKHLAEVEGGLSQAALLRRLIRQEARKRGLWPEAQAQGQPQEARHAD